MDHPSGMMRAGRSRSDLTRDLRSRREPLQIHWEIVMVDRSESLVRELRTPRAAAIAGIAFALLLSAAVLLMQWAIPRDGDAAAWVTEDSRRRAVAVAIGLIPYAGIAFLWFIGVVRSRLGDLEDRFFATAFLGSGLLFVAMLFTGAAVTGAVLKLSGGAGTVSSDDARLTYAIVSTLLGTFGIRMAAVFTLVVTNLGRRTGIVPRWLVAAGYITGGVMLIAPPRTMWATLLFPTWVLALSVNMLVLSLRRTTYPVVSSD